MFNICKKEQNKYFLSSNKNQIKTNLKFESFFPFNLENKLCSADDDSKNEQIDFNKNNDTCVYSLNNSKKERKTFQKDFLGKKIQFKISLESYKKNNKFNVVRTQKNSERWNKMEKFKFLEGIYKFGCNWKVIKKKLIGSRTTKQVRSHAQKFILKLRKFKDDSLGIDFTKDSDKNSHELIKNLKYIIENSSNKDILYILCKKLSQKKTKKNNKRNYKANTNIIKNESINDLKTNDVKDTTFNYNTSIYEDYSKNKKETSFIENNNEIYDNDIKYIENCKKKDYELNSTLSCIIETNHYNILNTIVFEDNKLNSFDFLENEEKRIFWNINDKINILENENESYDEKISKTNSLNLLLSVYNSEFEEFKTINIINKEYCS